MFGNLTRTTTTTMVPLLWKLLNQSKKQRNFVKFHECGSLTVTMAISWSLAKTKTLARINGTSLVG
eukprot:183533-Karenia_brevis.AAC.1